MDFGPSEHELQLKRYIIAMVIQEAKSDQDFSIIEKKYLTYVSKNLGLSDAEVAAIRLSPTDFEMKPPASEQIRMNVLYYLLFMMYADKTIKKEEEAVCHHIGFRLGFRRDMVSDLISVMRDCIDNKIPPNTMLEQVKTYLN